MGTVKRIPSYTLYDFSIVLNAAREKFSGHDQVLNEMSRIYSKLSYLELMTFIKNAPENGKCTWDSFEAFKRHSKECDENTFAKYARFVIEQSRKIVQTKELSDIS